MNPLMIKAASVFGAGLLTSLTPCIYPMIPITVGYLGSARHEDHRKKTVIGFFLGQVLAFTALGVAAVSLGEILGFSSELQSVQFGTAAFLFVFGFFSWKGQLPGFLQKLNNLPFLKTKNSATLAGAIVVGAISALVASPCASPILGGVLATIAQTGSLVTGALLMLFYSVGVSVIFLVLGLGLVSAAKLPKAGNWMVYVHKGSAVLLMGAGGYYLLRGLEVL